MKCVRRFTTFSYNHSCSVENRGRKIRNMMILPTSRHYMPVALSQSNGNRNDEK